MYGVSAWVCKRFQSPWTGMEMRKVRRCSATNLKSTSEVEGFGDDFEIVLQRQSSFSDRLSCDYAVISGLLGRLLWPNSLSHLAEDLSHSSSHCAVIKRKNRDFGDGNLNLFHRAILDWRINSQLLINLLFTWEPRMKVIMKCRDLYAVVTSCWKQSKMFVWFFLMNKIIVKMDNCLL